MEAFEEKWVNHRNYKGKNHTLNNHSSTSIVFGVNLLRLGGFHLWSNEINNGKILHLHKI